MASVHFYLYQTVNPVKHTLIAIPGSVMMERVQHVIKILSARFGSVAQLKVLATKKSPVILIQTARPTFVKTTMQILTLSVRHASTQVSQVILIAQTLTGQP
jgi:hypothetical protein